MNNFYSMHQVPNQVPNPNINLNNYRRTFLDDSFISLNSKGLYNPSSMGRLGDNLFSAPMGSDGFYGAPNAGNANNSTSTSTSNSTATSSPFNTTNLSNIWAKEPLSTSSMPSFPDSAVTKYDLPVTKLGSNSLWSGPTSQFRPTDSILTTSATPSVADSNPVSNKESVSSSSINKNHQDCVEVGNDSFTTASAQNDNYFSNMNNKPNDQHAYESRNSVRTVSTTTPSFMPFDQHNNSSTNTISSYLDINTSSFQRPKLNNFNSSRTFATDSFSSFGLNTQSFKTPTSFNNTPATGCETPLTTPVLSSNLYSRFFPSPNSERIRYNYNTVNNTPSTSHNNYGNDNITHLNLASNTEFTKNSDNFYLDLGFGAFKQGPAGLHNPNDNVNNVSESLFQSNTSFVNFNPSNSILDTLKNKSVDSFDMAFSKSNEDLVPNFVYDELQDSSADPFLSPYNNDTNLFLSNLPESPTKKKEKNSNYFTSMLNATPFIPSKGKEIGLAFEEKKTAPTFEEKEIGLAFEEKKAALNCEKNKTAPTFEEKEADIKPTRKLVVHSNQLEQELQAKESQYLSELQHNNSDESDILVSLVGYNLKTTKSLSENSNKRSKHKTADLKHLTNDESFYPEGFASTFYKRADNNFMFVREIQAKSTIIKFRSLSIIEFKLSLPSIPLFDKQLVASPDSKKKKYKLHSVQINLNELEGKIGGLRVSKQQALQQQQKHENGSTSSFGNVNNHGKHNKSKHKLKKYPPRTGNAYYYKKGYSNKIGGNKTLD